MQISATVCATVALILAATPVLPDATNAAPVIILTKTPFDWSDAAWVTNIARIAIAQIQLNYSAGGLTAYAIAAAPNGNWGIAPFPRAARSWATAPIWPAWRWRSANIATSCRAI